MHIKLLKLYVIFILLNKNKFEIIKIFLFIQILIIFEDHQSISTLALNILKRWPYKLMKQKAKDITELISNISSIWTESIWS